jgi:hypothetical protein
VTAMQVGIQFFPDVGPEQKSARDYWQEALHLVGLVDRYGYSHVRTIEHYFNAYGGYSPNPIVFLAAAAQVTRKARLVTGAVLPAFNNPLKLAGEMPAPSCHTSSPISASRWTRAGRDSTRASTRCAACWRKKPSPRPGGSTASAR